MQQDRVSRRRLLGRAAAAAGLAGLAAACAGETAPSGKLTQRMAQYQDHPNGFQKCGVCANFRPPSECRLVESPVAAGGWCTRYRPRNA